MARFIVRVELHDASTWQDYELLHKKMEAEGFTRTITGSNGVTYHLPPAEYEMQGSYSKEEVLTKAERAASQTRKRHGIIVTEANGQIWRGLKEV